MAVRPMSQMGQSDIAPRSSDVRSSPQHRPLLRPLAMFEECLKRRSPPHSITARHSGSRGKHRNRVTTWSYTSTDLPDGQISFVLRILSVQSRLQKYFAFGVGQIKSTTRAVLSHRGALRNVTNAGRDAVDADALSDEGR
jgi:hypothetical protein